MRKRPFLLFLAALLFLYFPAEYAFRVSRGAPLSLAEILFSGLLPLFCLIGLVQVTKIGWYSLVAFAFIWGAKDVLHIYESQGTARIMPVLVHLFVYSLSLTYFINPRIRTLYFDPKMRWWRSKKRNETHTPILIHHGVSWSYPIMRNISEGGCFIETAQGLKRQDRIKVMIPLPVPFKLSLVEAKGEVRWVADKGARTGMGIQFDPLPKHHFRALKKFVASHL